MSQSFSHTAKQLSRIIDMACGVWEKAGMITLNGAPINVTMFPDKTSQVWKLPQEQLTARTPASVCWRFENEGEFMHLAQLCDLLKECGRPFSIELPYLPYARQDKEIANSQTFALHTFAKLLGALGAVEVALFDPHNREPVERHLAARGTRVAVLLFDMQARSAFSTANATHWAFPDAGACGRYHHLCGEDESPIIAFKTRDQSTGEITRTAVCNVEPGARVMIVDDICDGGATFIGLAKALREKGAHDVFLFVSHGLFTRGLAPLFDAGISRIFTPEGEKKP